MSLYRVPVADGRGGVEYLEVEADSPEEAKLYAAEGPSAGQAALQGAMVEAPTSWGAMADLGRSFGELGLGALERTVFGPTIAGIEGGERADAPGAYRFGDLSAAARRGGQKALASIGRPYRQPRAGSGQAYLQRGVGGAVASAPFAAAPIPGIGLGARAALEMGSGALSEVAAEGARGAGFGPTGQAVAGTVAGMAPMGAFATVGPLARGFRRLAPTLTRGAAETEGARRMQALVGGGDPARLARARAQLDEEMARAFSTAPEDVGAGTSVDVLRGDFPEVETMAASIGRESEGLKGRAQTRLAENLSALESRVPDYADPTADPFAVRSRLEAEMAQNAEEQRRAYGRAAELGGTGSTEPLHRELARQRGPREMGKALEGEIPRTPKRVIEERYVEEVMDPISGEKATRPSMEPVDELHNFRKLVNAELERVAADPGGAVQTRNLMGLKRAVDEALTEAATSGDVAAEKVAALREAIALTARQEQVYAGHPAIQAFTKYVDDPQKALRTAVSATVGEQRAEARNLRAALRGDRQAEEGLKRAYVRHILLGERAEADIGDVKQWVGNTRMARRRLAQSRAAGEEWLSPEGVRSLERFLRRAEQIGTPIVGSGKQAKATQSGIATQEMLGLVNAPASTLGGWAVNAVAERFGRKLRTLLEDAMIEPRVMRVLLEKNVTPKGFEKWAQRVEAVYEKSFGRQIESEPEQWAQRGYGARHGLRGAGASREEGER